MVQLRSRHNLRRRGAPDRGCDPPATLPAQQDSLRGPELRPACPGAEDASSGGAHTLSQAAFRRPATRRPDLLSPLQPAGGLRGGDGRGYRQTLPGCAGRRGGELYPGLHLL